MASIDDLREIVRRARRLSERTKTLYLDGLGSFEAFCAQRSLSLFSGRSVEDWRDHLERRGETWKKGTEPLSPQSVNTKLKGVKYASKWFARREAADGRVAADFASYVEPLKEGPIRRTPTVVTIDDVRRLLATVEGNTPSRMRDRAIMTLGFRTGVRRAAIAGATRAQWSKTHFTFVNKGGDTIKAPLDPDIHAAMDPWLAWLDYNDIHTGALFRSLSPTSWLKPLRDDGLYEVLQARGAAIGLALHPHAMRHFYVTESRRAGVPDWVIAQRTGHKPNKSGQYEMMDTYSHDDTTVYLPSF